MPDPLDTRLRAALGPDGPAGRSSRTEPVAAVCAHVLHGLHRRRMRRLQIVGGAAVLAIALAVTLPVVLADQASPSGGESAAGPSGTGPAAGGSRHGGGVLPQPPASLDAAECRVVGRTLAIPCGAVTSGVYGTLSPPASSTSSPRAATGGLPVRAAPAVGGSITGTPAHVLTLGPGGVLHVTLPAPPVGTQWGRPRLMSSTPTSGSGPVIRLSTRRPLVYSQQGHRTAVPVVIDAVHEGTVVVAVPASSSCTPGKACPATATFELSVNVRAG